MSSFTSSPSIRTTPGVKTSWVRSYWELTKPRLSFLSVLTALAGYLVANTARDIPELIAVIIGTSLSAGGAAALNQWLERDLDARMVRTRNRPLPLDHISGAGAFLWGAFLSYGGTFCLFSYVNALAGFLALLTIVSYVWVYTPLKTRTLWAMHVGAIPGALPPLIGWTAATGAFGELGWVLFGILFAWQMPHFMAIVWTYRRDYAEANMPMVSVVDPTGRRAGLEAVIFACLTWGISLWPVVCGITTAFYGIVAGVMGLYYFGRAYQFAVAKSKDRPARRLFFASIFYLPPVLAALVLDRWLLV